MKLISLKVFVSVIFLFTLSCASPQKSNQQRVSVGMDKDQVLQVLGNPSRSKRVSGSDRWSYDEYVDGSKQVLQVYFQNGRVRFVGTDEAFEKSLLTPNAKKSQDQNAGFKDIE